MLKKKTKFQDRESGAELELKPVKLGPSPPLPSKKNVGTDQTYVQQWKKTTPQKVDWTNRIFASVFRNVVFFLEKESSELHRGRGGEIA